MTIFFAFLAGFYVGVFAISLLVVAGRRKEKEKEDNSSAGTAPNATNGPFLELAIKDLQALQNTTLSVLINQKIYL